MATTTRVSAGGLGRSRLLSLGDAAAFMNNVSWTASDAPPTNKPAIKAGLRGKKGEKNHPFRGTLPSISTLARFFNGFA
jgi:hypothetical protein